ncbi:FecR family protein [Chitinophaga arvensicola]|uniref:Ferric-dicitrate binding protein FerR, regulates iron transport through sigma-19 n=1 Tax=Chitinophaga arvensicola TaxID=29529 RepID=A0A1I0SD13_9BACT|nr:FecR domain-containing protein [Chitinophaga arvensicola]SEW55016.1 ferric-dicitrate binding protein FerR, regulates iron transport through sigma-19 [Chitinophaga arvensicola]
MNFQEYEVIDFACDESFQRYCLEADDRDLHFWENWLTQHPEKRLTVQEAREIVMILSAKQGNRLEQLKHLEDGIARYDLLQEALEEEQPPVVLRRRHIWKYAAIATGVLLLAGSSFLFFRHTPAPAEKHQLVTAGQDPRKTLVLPDGSSVILRQHSSLQLAPGFNKDNRNLTLTGEAFFDVTQNAQHPFMVHTAALDIKVLGTVFNVSAYTNSRETETALFKGKIEVTLPGQPQQKIILQPNQKLVTHAATPFAIAPLDADPVSHKAREIAWVRNRLEIENEPLEVIAGKLEQWYGIRVVFADETVKHYRYSGTFESETIIKALDALQLSYPFSFKMEQGEIIISK